MGTTPYPLPRAYRQSDILDCDGVALTYGPFTFKIFDVEDVVVFTRAAADAAWQVAVVTVTKVTGLPFDDFRITFASLPAASVDFIVIGLRNHEREYGITKGNALDTDQLEKELSKQGVVIGELRRDIDRAHKAPFGSAGGDFDASDIGDAQAHAAATAADRAAVAADRVIIEDIADGLAIVLDGAAPVADMFAELAALNPALTTHAFCNEQGWNALYIWSGANLSAALAAQVASDHRYVAPNFVGYNVNGSNGAWVYQTPNWQYRDKARYLDDFLIGDGVTDNAGARAAALASEMAADLDVTWKGGRGKTYKFGADAALPMRHFDARGSVFAWSHDTHATGANPVFTFAELVNIDGTLDIRALAGAKARRHAQFSADGLNGEIRVRSDAQMANYFNSELDRAARFTGHDADIVLAVQMIDYGAIAYSAAFNGADPNRNFRCQLKPSKVRLGLELRTAANPIIHDGYGDGDSLNKTGDPGNNIILLSGVSGARIFGNMYSKPGEHVIRDGGAKDAGASDGADNWIFENEISDAGETGIKIWSGNLANPKRRIRVFNNLIKDCGRNGLGFNRYGVMFQNTIDGEVSGNVVTVGSQAFSAYDGIYASSLTRGQIHGNKIINASRHSFMISEYSGNGTDPASINGLLVTDNYSETPAADHFVVEVPAASFRHFHSAGNLGIGGVNGWNWTGAAARAAQPCRLAGMFNGESGTAFIVPSGANLRPSDEFTY